MKTNKILKVYQNRFRLYLELPPLRFISEDFFRNRIMGNSTDIIPYYYYRSWGILQDEILNGCEGDFVVNSLRVVLALKEFPCKFLVSVNDLDSRLRSESPCYSSITKAEVDEPIQHVVGYLSICEFEKLLDSLENKSAILKQFLLILKKQYE